MLCWLVDSNRPSTAYVLFYVVLSYSTFRARQCQAKNHNIFSCSTHFWVRKRTSRPTNRLIVRQTVPFGQTFPNYVPMNEWSARPGLRKFRRISEHKLKIFFFSPILRMLAVSPRVTSSYCIIAFSRSAKNAVIFVDQRPSADRQ